MLAHSFHAPSPLADVIYAKTLKGRDEVAQRRGGLSSRQRSILIVLDGEKRVDSLLGLMPAAQVQAILDELAALGLIAPVSGPEPSAVTLVPVRRIDEARVAQVKHMMTGSAETYLGPMAAELIRQVQTADDETGLQRALAHWHMAMQASKYGREVAESHLALIRANLEDVLSHG
jgi:hypothetical protein